MPVNPPPRHKRPAPPPAPPFTVTGGSGGAGGSAPVRLIYGTSLNGTRGTPIGNIEAQMFAKSIELQNEYFDRIMASKVETSRIEITSLDDVERRFIDSPRPGAINTAIPEIPDQRLRRMLAEDAKAELQHATTIITPAPPRRPLLTTAIYAWTWLRVIYRELYGPAYLRRYL